MGAAPQGLTSHPIAANHWWTTGRKRTPVNTTTTAAANAGSAKQGRKPYNSSQFPDPADFWKRRKKVVLLFVCPLASWVGSGESRAGERDFCEQLLPTILLVWLPGPTMHTISFLTHILNLCLLGLMVNIVHLPPIRRFLYQNLLETRGLKGDNVFMIGGGWST